MTFVYINPLILNHGHQMGFVSLALLVNGIAGVIGTSLGGILADKLSSKRWLIIAFSIFIVMMLIMNLILHTVTLLLIGLFIWNIVQWSTNPAIQSGIIEHVEGDTSQVMSWNMSSLNAGIGFGGIIGGLVVSNISVQAVTIVSAMVGAMGLIIVISLKNMSYIKISRKWNRIHFEFIVPLLLFIYITIRCLRRIRWPRHSVVCRKID